ncbi:MAG: hypothetical protein ABI488_25805 [Polyangiaceae bacterium]
MSNPRIHLGDSHNFGRRVSRREGRIAKPRTLLWEWLLLSADSPLRRVLDEAAEHAGLGREAFGFLPTLEFFELRGRAGGEVESVQLEALPPLDGEGTRALAGIVGRSLALWSWFGVADLHWENLVLGLDARGRTVFGPLDVEMILADLARPTETKLLPDADPEYAAICRHAAGVRRVLPYLGKPIAAADLVEMASAYHSTLRFLDRQAPALAAVFESLPELRDAPIRVCLRGTAEYVSPPHSLWPPLLEAETEQLARGDIPYFFRLYGRPGIHYYGDEALTELKQLPLTGDVPQLEPLLSLSRGLRSPSRKRLHVEGLFTLLGAFDHRSLSGSHRQGAFEIAFRGRTLVVRLPDGQELETRRDLSAFVGSVYLPCACGEVRSVFVPPVTVCSAPSANAP